MRDKELKVFGDPQSGRLNSDDSPFAVNVNEWVNAENVRSGTTDKGATGIVESVGGNVSIPSPANLPSVVIGGQKWTLNNLDVTSYRNGDPINFISNSVDWAAATEGAWCWYNDNPATGIKLYNWFSVNDIRGLAPFGWRIPTNIEYATLSAYLGGNSVSGGNLKSVTGWDSPNTGATNSSGFTALPNGFRDLSGDFAGQTSLGVFWTSDGDPTLDLAISKTLAYNSAAITTSAFDSKKSGYSIRLIAPSSVYLTIGTIEDTENNRICYFNCDTNAGEDKIVCLYTDTNTSYNVLLSSQVVGGLNFDKDSLIHSAHIANGILSWTDGINNQPRKINIESGIVANYPTFVTNAHHYVFPINFSEITLIKPPPTFTPNFIKNTDANFLGNFIANDSFQFAFQYQYYDNEITVVGAYTQSTKLNNPLDTFNRVVVTMDFIEIIPETVEIVSLIVRFSESNDAFIVNRWDKRNSVDLALINGHNDNTIALTYNFYNDRTGEFIAQGDVLRPFDAVPVYSQTHEIAKQRYFLANNIDGYDTPQYSSMTLGVGSYTYPTNTIKTTTLIKIQHAGYRHWYAPEIDFYGYTGYYVYLAWATQPGYYVCNTYEATAFYTTIGTIFPTVTPPTTIAFSGLTFRGATIQQVWQNTKPAHYTLDIQVKTPLQSNFPITGISLDYYNIFPQISNYKSGIVFYDFAMRKCGVVSNGQSELSDTRTVSYFHVPLSAEYGFNVGSAVIDLQIGQTFTISGLDAGNGTYTVSNLILLSGDTIVIVNGTIPSFTTGSATITWAQDCAISTPQRDYAYSSGIDSFIWRVNNDNRLSEIPDWAYYYAPVLTKNLTKRFFISSYTPSAIYATKDVDGNYIYTSINFTQQAVAIAINTTALNQSGLGYVFTEGDICILTSNDNSYWVLPVIGQDANYILLKCQNIGSVINHPYVYEIYNPYKTSEQEPFYEMGEVYTIDQPTTAFRNYSILFGYFNSDSYILTRSFAPSTTYLAGAMSPNDLYYKNWYTDSGKVNIVTKLGQANNNTEVVWSDTYISGTQINGSSTFRIGAQTFVSNDCGSIIKIQNTSKVQDQGTVMLAICVAETNSMYLGETQITDSTGGVKFFSSGTGVIGTINILKGNYGCISPESVVQYRGNVYFFDASNGRWVQYSSNGLDAISSLKMVRFWKNWSYKYLSMTKAEIEVFGNRPYVFATVDAGHDELLISIPKLSDDPPKGFLPDYPSMIYPFDILDYQGKTIVYKLGTGAVVTPHWQGAYKYNTEYFATIQNRLFTFKDGSAWEQNQANQNQFFNSQFTSKIMFTSNILPQVPKVYDNFLSESNLVPNFVYFYNEYPYLQSSDLEAISFSDLEGIWYASILRNKIVPTTTGDVYTGLLTAEVMRNTNMYVLVEYSPTTSPLQLRLLQIGMSISKGHNF